MKGKLHARDQATHSISFHVNPGCCIDSHYLNLRQAVRERRGMNSHGPEQGYGSRTI
jgi:hypothetical protein